MYINNVVGTLAGVYIIQNTMLVGGGGCDGRWGKNEKLLRGKGKRRKLHQIRSKRTLKQFQEICAYF